MFGIGQTFKPIVGLDFSSTGIKMAELRPAGKKWKLFHCGFAPLPIGAIAESQVKDKDAVSQTLRELLKEHKVTTKQVAFGVNGSAVIIKKIQLAAVTELELEDTIATEAEEYIPFDIDEVHLDFQILGRNQENMDVLLVACKKDAVKTHLEVLEGMGLVPKVLDLDLFAIGNFYLQIMQSGGEKSPETVAVVNAGATVTNMAILVNGTPEFTRDHLFGCRHLIEDMQRTYDLSSEDAERMLSGKPNAGGQVMRQPADFQQELLHPFLSQLHVQISQSMDFFMASHQDRPVGALYLAGGCAMLPGVESFLSEQMNLPVKRVDPFQLVSGDKETQAGGTLHDLSTRFMVAIGLALRGNV